MTQTQLKELMTYDPATGFLKWKNPHKARKLKPSDMPDGHVSKSGYIVFYLNYKAYKAHRLIWLYMTGKLPNGQIDHIDGDRSNNKFSNLREVTSQQNSFNTEAKGYVHNKKYNRYLVRVGVNNTRIFIGCYNSPEEARIAYLEAKIKYHGIEFSGRVLDKIKTTKEEIYD